MASRAALARVRQESQFSSQAARPRPGSVRPGVRPTVAQTSTLDFGTSWGLFPQPPSLPGGPTLPGGGMGFDVAASPQNGLPGVAGGVVTGGCEALGLPAWLCEPAGDFVGGLIPGGGGGGGGGGQPGTGLAATCEQQGLVTGADGMCYSPGSPASNSVAMAKMGIFGAPAVPPQVVGTVARTTGCGGVSPIRRCPSGTVLGKDNLCYAKGSIPNKLRKWPKTAKAPVTAYDARMMRKYGPGGSKQSGVKRLAGAAGLTCKRK